MPHFYALDLFPWSSFLSLYFLYCSLYCLYWLTCTQSGGSRWRSSIIFFFQGLFSGRTARSVGMPAIPNSCIAEKETICLSCFTPGHWKRDRNRYGRGQMGHQPEPSFEKLTPTFGEWIQDPWLVPWIRRLKVYSENARAIVGGT